MADNVKITFTECPACDGGLLQATERMLTYLDVEQAEFDIDTGEMSIVDATPAFMDEPQYDGVTIYCENDCSSEQIADAMRVKHKALIDQVKGE